MHILCIYLHIYFAYKCIYVHINYLFLHIFCMYLHIFAYKLHISAFILHMNAYLLLFFCILWHIFSFFCIYLHIFAYLYIFPYFTIQVSMFHFSSILHDGYILEVQDIAQEFTNHHRLPSPSPGFKSQDPPSKSAASPLMLKGMVPVSPTGTNGSLDKMDVIGRTYSTCVLLLCS